MKKKEKLFILKIGLLLKQNMELLDYHILLDQ